MDAPRRDKTLQFGGFRAAVVLFNQWREVPEARLADSG